MICAPSSSSVSCGTPFTDATVPTGMNTGVSISACGVSRRPRRALPLTASMWNEMDIVSDCSNGADQHLGTSPSLPQRTRQRAALASLFEIWNLKIFNLRSERSLHEHFHLPGLADRPSQAI